MSDEYPLMAFIANEGVAPKGERYDRSALVTDTVNKLYKKTEKGDFIYSSNNLETGSIGLNKYGKACISPVYSIFEPTGIADSDFLGRRLVRKDFINAMVKWRQGVIYGQWRIHESDFLKIEITVPSVEEQRKIGAYLDQLDNLITLHQRKFEKLTNVKKSMLEKMFPQNGSSYPEIRFKGFTDPWEQRKFDEVFDCTVPNNTLSRAELSYDEGTVLNVHYGDVLIKYGSVLDVQKDDIPRIPHRCREDFNGALLQDGDVIIADTAEDETTGKACEIGNLQGSAIVSGLHTMVCRPRNRMALGYLGYYLNSNAYHHQLLPLMQGIKVLSLSRSNIQKTSVSYPIAVKEQQLIAYYFSQLDNLITLHQRKCIFFTGRAGRLISTVNKKRITSSWEQRKLASLCEKFTDGDWIESKDQSDFGVRLVQTGNVGVAEYLDKPNNKKWISEDTFDRLHCEEVLPGDILISRLPEPAGRACIVPLLGTKMITAVDCTIVRTAPDMSNKFLVQYLSSQAYFDDVNTCLAGGTRQRISRGNLANFNVPIPVKKSEQDAIGMFFGYLDNLITLHQRKPFLMKWRTSDANRNQTNRLVL